MADDKNKVEHVAGFYESKQEVGQEDKQEKENMLPIPLPPENVMRSAFLTAVKYRSVKTALVAYHDCVNELAGIKRSHANLTEAQIEEQRAIKLLEESGMIHEMDSNNREYNRLDAEDRLAQKQHEIELNKKLREMELVNAARQHEKFMVGSGETELSQADQELKDYMKSKIFKARREREIAEQIRKEGNLTKEEEAILDQMVEELTTPGG